MIIDTDELVNGAQAAKLCGLSLRHFYDSNRELRSIPVMGGKGYLRQEVIEWNRARLASLKRHWKKHDAWQAKNASPAPLS